MSPRPGMSHALVMAPVLLLLAGSAHARAEGRRRRAPERHSCRRRDQVHEQSPPRAGHRRHGHGQDRVGQRPGRDRTGVLRGGGHGRRPPLRFTAPRAGRRPARGADPGRAQRSGTSRGGAYPAREVRVLAEDQRAGQPRGELHQRDSLAAARRRWRGSFPQTAIRGLRARRRRGDPATGCGGDAANLPGPGLQPPLLEPTARLHTGHPGAEPRARLRPAGQPRGGMGHVPGSEQPQRAPGRRRPGRQPRGPRGRRVHDQPRSRVWPGLRGFRL